MSGHPVRWSHLADQQLKQAVEAPPWDAAEALVAGATISTTAATVPVKTAAILRMMFSMLDGRGPEGDPESNWLLLPDSTTLRDAPVGPCPFGS